MRHFAALLLLVAATFAATASAQSNKSKSASRQSQKVAKVAISGRVLDSESGEALSHATVQLLGPDSTRLITGAITGTNGSFTTPGVAAGAYVVKVSYLGYHNFFRALTVTADVKERKFGTIMLTPSSVLLQAATVTAQMKQVEVREDTLLFNADAFKVPEGGVLEELIRKLPGAEVSSDGTVKINGKTVKKILVEGKEFFSNDKSVAMKNLPSEIVDKVKTYDKQSDMARMTGIDDGEEETVIDLTIKKGMKQGWFGNADLAGGTKERFAERLMVNRFTDGTQASVIGNYNNTGGRGFGGGGGRGGGGVTTNGNVAANIALDRGDWEIGGSVNGNGSNSDNRSWNSSQNFVTTRTSFSNSMNKSLGRNRNFGANFRIEWRPDSMTTINLRPNLSLGSSRNTSGGESATFNADPYLDGRLDDPLHNLGLIPDSIKVNLNETDNRSTSDNHNFSANLIANRRLGTNGRNVSLSLSASSAKTTSKNHSLSDVRYFQYGDSTRLTYRYRTTPNSSSSFSAGLNYTQPIIAKRFFFQTDYRFNHSHRHSDGATYDIGADLALLDSIRATGAGFMPADYRQYLSDDLSRYTDDDNDTHTLNLQLRLVTKKINMNAGVNVQLQHQKIDYQYQGLDTVASRNFSRISPTLNFRYKFSARHTLRVRYRGNTQQPNITDLFNQTDNSNPLNIRMGNPDLKPSFTNNLNIDWNNYVVSTMQSYVASLSFSNTLNSIQNRTQYDDTTGGRITRPENINGDWNMSGHFGFTTPLFSDYFNVSTNTSARYTHNVAYLYQNQRTQKNTVTTTQLGQRLSLMYRSSDTPSGDYYDISANGNINYNHTRSLLVPTNNRDTYDFSYGLSATYTFYNGLAFSTNIDMSSRRGYSSASMNTNELIWNAQASYRFLRSRQATVMLQAYDILARRSNISRMISATSRSDSETNAINSYLMLHFIYRMNFFGSAQGRRDMRAQRRGDF